MGLAQRSFRTVEQTVVPCREKRAPRGELCLPQSLISRALDGASMPLGLGRRPGTQGQCNHPTPHTTIVRGHFDLRHEPLGRPGRRAWSRAGHRRERPRLLKTVGGLNASSLRANELTDRLYAQAGSFLLSCFLLRFPTDTTAPK